MFEIMLEQLRENVTQMLSVVELSMEDGYVGLAIPEEGGGGGGGGGSGGQETRQDPALMGTGAQASPPPQQQQKGNVQQMPKKRAFNKDDPESWGKVPRNSPCPCESGKKYKHCHGKISQVFS